MLVSSNVSGSAFYASATRWVATDPDVFYWYSQEDNTISIRINDTASEVTIRVETMDATYNINVYCTSVIDLGEYVRETAPDGTMTVTFLEEGEEVETWMADVRFGFYPTEIVIPPPFLPYYDSTEEVRLPLVATSLEGCMEAMLPDGTLTWKANDNMETQVSSTGSYGLLWRVAGESAWRYCQPIRIPNGCESVNLRWYSRNGLLKAWVFEVSSVTTEVPDPVEIITDRGIGFRRIGAPTRTMTVKTPGCNIYTRKWLSDLATSPVTYMLRPYTDEYYNKQSQFVPVTCESVEIDFSEKVADFEAVVNIEKGRTL